MESTGYAFIWWDKEQNERERLRESLVNSWEEMKRLMRIRYFPFHYHRDFHNKLQSFKREQECR